VTLVQVLANEMSLHMACDFRLTNPYTGKLEQDDAFKIVSVTPPMVSGLIGVTGLGSLDGKPIGNWIAEVVAELQGRGSADDVLDVLVRRGRGAVVTHRRCCLAPSHFRCWSCDRNADACVACLELRGVCSRSNTEIFFRQLDVDREQHQAEGRATVCHRSRRCRFPC
jgi:hypothetical protein